MATLQSIDNNIKTFTVNNLSICHLPYGTYESEHVHNGIEIVYIVNGMGEHCINGKKYNVKKGSVIIVNPFELHCFTAIDNFEYYNLNFECAFLSEEFKHCKTIWDIMNSMGYDLSSFQCAQLKSFETVERVFNNIWLEYKQKQKNYEAVIRNYIEILIHIFARINISEHISENDVENTSNEIYKNLDTVLTYIDNNLERKISLNEISSKFGYSPNYFSRILKNKYNMTFKQLLTKKRIMKSVDYIMHTNYNIDDIAKMCGFTNLTFYYNKFEEIVRIKPKQIKEYCARYSNK